MICLDTLICHIHNPILTIIPYTYSTPCTLCLQDIQNQKKLYNHLSRLQNIIILLKQLYNKYIILHNDQLAKELFKYIWLTENIIQHPHIHYDYYLFKKLSKSFDLTYNNSIHNNIISIENIEDIELTIKLCTEIQNNLFISIYPYITGLLQQILHITLEIQLKCIQYLL